MRAGFRWLALLFATTGCATVVKGEYSKVPVTSEPTCAAVYVNGVPSGFTPVTLTLASRNSHTIEVRVPGYESRAAATDRMILGGWLVLDILLAIVPAIIDGATGAWYDQQPESLHFVLKEGKAPPDNYPAQASTREACLEPLLAAQERDLKKREAQQAALASCLKSAEKQATPELVAWSKADCASPRPPMPPGLTPTRRAGEKCTWSGECQPGLACPWGHCIPWEGASASR